LNIPITELNVIIRAIPITTTIYTHLNLNTN
jgi:hypothetical protein